jgi:hypothetical protein
MTSLMNPAFLILLAIGSLDCARYFDSTAFGSDPSKAIGNGSKVTPATPPYFAISSYVFGGSF